MGGVSIEVSQIAGHAGSQMTWGGIRSWSCSVARAASDTFAGIRPADAPGFIVAQLAGAAAATALFRWLVPSLPKDAGKVVVPHTQHESTHAR